MRLAEFNALQPDAARAFLRPCVDCDRWTRAVVEARPFPDTAELLRVADSAAEPFTADEIDAALAHHPRIGERAHGASHEAAMSRSEQSGITADHRILEGNRRYEERFGRVFLIRAAGRTSADILANLERRLRNTPEDELAEVAQQLREIALLRLRQLIDVVSHVTTHVLDITTGVPASGVLVRLDVQTASTWEVLASGVTDSDGRVRNLGPESLSAGTYRLSFDTGGYFAAHGTTTFFPEVTIGFAIADESQHYHVPLLISPFAYSTYRGS